jgi:outer membrane protein TolC
MRLADWGLAATLGLLLAGCKVGPDYKTPSVPITDRFKEATPADYRTAGTWRPAVPSDHIDRGKWWEIFGDPVLNRLEDELTVSNQNLKQSEARFREARAMIRYQRAAEFPTIGTGVDAASVQSSSNQPYFQLSNPQALGQLRLHFDLDYEVDLWGRIGRSVEAAREEAQATAADLATASLSLHSELALDYIEVRAADAQQHLLDDTVKAYEYALRLTRNRLAGGYAPESDVLQAQTQLDTTRVQATDIGVLRAQYEHAIAVLMGQPPASFTLPPAPLDLQPPGVPAGVPSELLQRRPDIAAAERRVAEANEQIGIADAAFYPSLNLFWAVGTSLTQPLFDGGRIRAQSDQARAAYDANVAGYRQTTLTAFQEVEDNLSALRILGLESKQQRAAVESSGNSLRTFTNRYLGGQDNYLNVITAQTIALQNQRNDVDIQRRRMEADILLIKALGGGWDVGQLPKLEDKGEKGFPRGAVVPFGQPR